MTVVVSSNVEGREALLGNIVADGVGTAVGGVVCYGTAERGMSEPVALEVGIPGSGSLGGRNEANTWSRLCGAFGAKITSRLCADSWADAADLGKRSVP